LRNGFGQHHPVTIVNCAALNFVLLGGSPFIVRVVG